MARKRARMSFSSCVMLGEGTRVRCKQTGAFGVVEGLCSSQSGGTAVRVRLNDGVSKFTDEYMWSGRVVLTFAC